jgi:hypothetical protein
LAWTQSAAANISRCATLEAYSFDEGRLAEVMHGR